MLSTDRHTDRQTGYPSIDMPWLQYYRRDSKSEIVAGNIVVPKCSFYQNLINRSSPYRDATALEYLGEHITYKELINNIECVAKSLKSIGVKQGQIVSVCLPNIPEAVYLFYAINRIGAVSNMLDLRCADKWLMTAINDAQSEVLICEFSSVKTPPFR